MIFFYEIPIAGVIILVLGLFGINLVPVIQGILIITGIFSIIMIIGCDTIEGKTFNVIIAVLCFVAFFLIMGKDLTLFQIIKWLFVG